LKQGGGRSWASKRTGDDAMDIEQGFNNASDPGYSQNAVGRNGGANFRRRLEIAGANIHDSVKATYLPARESAAIRFSNIASDIINFSVYSVTQYDF
jgi:hypothetical protein